MITFFQTLETQFIQIFPGGKTIRHIESRQLGYAEFNLHVASLRDLMSVFQGFQCIWEKLRHFLRRFHIILSAFITHSVFVCKFLVRLQTQKNIVGCSILCHCIMHVIGCHQIDPCFFVHAQKFLIYYLLCRNSMILQLQEEVSLSKDILITQRCCLCIFIHSSLKISGNLTCQTCT